MPSKYLFLRAWWLRRKEHRRAIPLWAHSDGKLHREPEQP